VRSAESPAGGEKFLEDWEKTLTDPKGTIQMVEAYKKRTGQKTEMVLNEYPSPRHQYHDHNSVSTEIYVDLRSEIPTRILTTRSRYIPFVGDWCDVTNNRHDGREHHQPGRVCGQGQVLR
jgi:hypothetical protein